MKHKGFTLIELLAVIVILAIIALIAVPIVLNIIKDSKENATLRSAELYMDAAELAITRANLETEIENVVCTIQNGGNLSCEGLTDSIAVDLKGEKPIDGIITFSKGKKVLTKTWIRMSNDDVYVYRNNALVKLDKSEEHDYIISTLKPGLYDENYRVVKTWQDLIDEGIITLDNGKITASDSIRQTSLIGELIISESVTQIGGLAFKNCKNLTSVTIPDSVTSIGTSGFNGCTSLTSITIPDSVTSIGPSVFRNCSSLTSVTIPDSVTSIGVSLFRDCTNLTSVTIPNSVTSIGVDAFRGCTGLTSITIPNSVTTIEDSAFRGCTGLTSIYIPSNVTTITASNASNSPFNGCSSSLQIRCGAAEKPEVWSTYWNYYDSSNALSVSWGQAR